METLEYVLKLTKLLYPLRSVRLAYPLVLFFGGQWSQSNLKKLGLAEVTEFVRPFISNPETLLYQKNRDVHFFGDKIFIDRN